MKVSQQIKQNGKLVNLLRKQREILERMEKAIQRYYNDEDAMVNAMLELQRSGSQQFGKDWTDELELKYVKASQRFGAFMREYEPDLERLGRVNYKIKSLINL